MGIDGDHLAPMKHCARCNLDFPEHFRFCGACGGALNTALSCPSCGEQYEGQRPFCTSCGSKLAPDEPQASTTPPTQETTPGSTELLSRKTMRDDEPGELYAADLYRKSVPPSTVADTDWSRSGDESVTVETRHQPEELHAPTTHGVSSASARHDGDGTAQLPGSTIAGHVNEPETKSAPTLSMMESYGAASTAPSPFRWRHGAILSLIVLLFVGGVAIGAWYWWSHRSVPAQIPVETPAAEQTTASAQQSVAPPINKVTSSKSTSATSADDEIRLLRDRTAKSPPAESNKIVAVLKTAEKKYPNDYRFPYERAKLSITGITSHHEAFDALAAAAEKAIDNGKAQEMLDHLNSDGAGDFKKLSHGHSEWHMLQEALRNKNKAMLRTLHR